MCAAGYPRALPVVPRSLSPSYPRPSSVIPALAAGISPRRARSPAPALRRRSRAGGGGRRTGLGCCARRDTRAPASVISALAFPVIPALAAGISPRRARSPAPALRRRSQVGGGGRRTGLGCCTRRDTRAPSSVIPALAAGISPRRRGALRLPSAGAPGWAEVGDERGLGAELGEIPAASAGMTDLILRGYDGSNSARV